MCHVGQENRNNVEIITDAHHGSLSLPQKPHSLTHAKLNYSSKLKQERRSQPSDGSPDKPAHPGTNKMAPPSTIITTRWRHHRCRQGVPLPPLS